MRKVVEKVMSWVVYKMPNTAKDEGRNVVCEQSEWDKNLREARPVSPITGRGLAAHYLSQSQRSRLSDPGHSLRAASRIRKGKRIPLLRRSATD